MELGCWARRCRGRIDRSEHICERDAGRDTVSSIRIHLMFLNFIRIWLVLYCTILFFSVLPILMEIYHLLLYLLSAHPSSCWYLQNDFLIFPRMSLYSNEKLVSISKASFAWPGETSLFADVEFNVSSKARFALLGKNGCGEQIFWKSIFRLLITYWNSIRKHSHSCHKKLLPPPLEMQPCRLLAS